MDWIWTIRSFKNIFEWDFGRNWLHSSHRSASILRTHDIWLIISYNFLLKENYFPYFEYEMKLKRSEQDSSEEFYIHTIQNTMKNVFKLPEITKKRLFGIVVNLALCTALIINLIWWQRHYQRLEPKSENWQYQRMSFGMNKSVKLSIAIDDVIQIFIFWWNQFTFRDTSIIFMRKWFHQQMKRRQEKSVLKIIFYQRKNVFWINSLE